MKRMRVTMALVTIALVALAVLPVGRGIHASGAHPARRAHSVPSVGGCGSLQRGTHAGRMVVDHLHRTYLIHVPSHLSPGHRYPLVLMFHGPSYETSPVAGYTGQSQQMERYSEMSTLADTQSFIVIYPSVFKTSPEPSEATWSADRSLTVDFDFVRALIRQLSPRLCVDHHRIYAAGRDDGGNMALALACHFSGTFAAIGTVGAWYPKGEMDRCHPRRWASVIAFHGTLDPYHPYADPDASPALTKRWAKAAGCPTGPTTMWRRKDVTAQNYTHCRGATEVQLYTIRGGGGTWPGQRIASVVSAGHVTHTIHASQTMWKFFQAHPLL